MSDHRIRNPLLSHWVGKHLSTSLEKLTDMQRKEYVEVAFMTLKEGLWMTVQNEIIRCKDKKGIQYSTAFVCFTELDPFYIHEHAQRYGLLGFVFHRDWLYERDGRPVFYVDDEDWRAGNFGELIEISSQLVSQLSNEPKFRIRLPNGEDGRSYLYRTIQSAKLAMMSMKDMGRKNNYDAYDEYEWRIIANKRLEDSKIILKNKSSKVPEFFLPFVPNDVQALTLPDEGTKQLFLSDSRYPKVFGDFPPMVYTIKEYSEKGLLTD